MGRAETILALSALLLMTYLALALLQAKKELAYCQWLHGQRW